MWDGKEIKNFSTGPRIEVEDDHGFEIVWRAQFGCMLVVFVTLLVCRSSKISVNNYNLEVTYVNTE